ncbi:monosaccharide ABC transporter substrate-binding protein, CUT2 family, partial [Coprococcus eutactus]|nr:monosaccharide ABC transporter substrate-binding protein, CUT2 family [Coprococcus eutactus]
YVRPELVVKIEKIIVETVYQNKIADKERKLMVGLESTIVAVNPNIESTIYIDMVAYVKHLVSVHVYQFLVAI